MDIGLIRTLPFRGWAALRLTWWSVGPLRSLRWLLERVHAEMVAEDGTFRGDGIQTYVNHPIAARVLLKLLVEQPTLATARGGWPMDPCGEKLVSFALQQLSEASGERARRSRPKGYDQVKPLSREHVERVAELMWLETLRERGRSYSTSYEVARAWLMLRTYWPACKAEVRGAVEHQLHEPLDTAFDSLEHALFLSIALYICHGVVDVPLHAFRNVTFRQQLPQFLSWYAPAAEDVVGDWPNIEDFGQRGIETCFHDTPIVRLADGRLLAPDLGVVLSGVATRSVTRAILHYAGQNDHVLESANTVLGFVFERYVAELVEECTRFSANARFEAEFKLQDNSDSPDAIIVEPTVTLFEAKVTRYPWPIERHLTPASFIDWLKKVSGERLATGRRPLEQGANFVDRWRQGDRECAKRLGAIGAFRYVVVTVEDLPPFLPWERYRDECWRPLLGPREQAFDRETLFLSIRDLEALAQTLVALARGGTPSSVDVLLREWRACWSADAHIAEGRSGTKPSLRGFLLRTYRSTSDDRPQFVSDAFREAWDWAEGMLR